MRNLLLFLPFILVAGVLLIPKKYSKYNNRDTKSSTGKILEPYEQMTFQRSYPYDNFDVNAYNELMNEARNFGFNRAGGTWEVAGPLNINGRINSVVVNPANSNEIYAGP